MSTGIIIQARANSSRFPGKVLVPFWEDQSILEILIRRLQANSFSARLVLATTDTPADDPVAELGTKLGVAIFRGDEADVLGRFLGAASDHELDAIVRVCADNPFLRLDALESLYQHYLEGPACDYLSYSLDGEKPTILSHSGLFVEVTNHAALQRAATLTQDPFFHEHVTNYLYTHPESFSIRLEPAPKPMKDRLDIRLTLDTPADMDYQQAIYAELYGGSKQPDLNTLINFLDTHPGYLNRMKAEIEHNQK